jgi:hypothetical protein
VYSHRQTEISLARTAAPAAISDHATILVLTRHGYEGYRGQQWFHMHGGTGVDVTIKETDLALARLSKSQIFERIQALVANKGLPMPEPGAMSYMMSKDGYLNDEVGHWHPHLMFHIPKTDAASWGANLPGSPVQLDMTRRAEPETIFMVPVGNWSDGTSAPAP